MDTLRHLERGLHTGNLDLEDPEVYNTIVKAGQQLEAAILVLHEFEDSKNEKFPNIPNIDKLFEGHPVNGYVQAMLGFLPSENVEGISMADLISNLSKAGMKLVEHQQKLEKTLQKTKNPEPKTEEDFINHFVDSLDLAHEGMADYHKESLRYAIDGFTGTYGGGSHFLVPLKSGVIPAKLFVKPDVIKITLEGMEYKFDRNQVHEEEYSAEEAAVEPVPCTCDEKSDCSKPCDGEKLSKETERTLKQIQAYLNSKKVLNESFDERDYEYIRYFLKHAEGASEEDLKDVSPRGLELAWNRHWYLKNEK